MRLELIFRDNEKDDKFYRRVIERVELDTGSRSPKGGHDLFEPVGGAMGNGDAETDAGAHRFLALFERSEDAFAIGWFDLAKANQQIDQLDDGRPTLGRLHLGNDLLCGK